MEDEAQALRKKLLHWVPPLVTPESQEIRDSLLAKVRAEKSCLLMGGPGCGKSLVMAEVMQACPEICFVQVDGSLCVNDALAIRWACQELQRLNGLDLGRQPPARTAGFVEHWSYFCELLTETPRQVVLVVDEFEVFVSRGKQLFLYNVLDASHKYRLSVVGMTRALNMEEKMEKRVRSRFILCRYLLKDVMDDFELYEKLIKARLQVPGEDLFNMEVDSAFFDQNFRKLVRTWFDAGRFPDFGIKYCLSKLRFDGELLKFQDDMYAPLLKEDIQKNRYLSHRLLTSTRRSRNSGGAAGTSGCGGFFSSQCPGGSQLSDISFSQVSQDFPGSQDSQFQAHRSAVNQVENERIALTTGRVATSGEAFERVLQDLADTHLIILACVCKLQSSHMEPPNLLSILLKSQEFCEAPGLQAVPFSEDRFCGAFDELQSLEILVPISRNDDHISPDLRLVKLHDQVARSRFILQYLPQMYSALSRFFHLSVQTI